MSNNVDITISSDARAAMNAWNSINRMAEKNISLMEKVESRSKKASQAFQSGARGGFLAGASRQLGGMLLGGVGANAILQRMTESGRQFAEQGLEAAKSWDRVWREFQGQSGLRGKLADLAEINVRKIAQETGVSVEEVGKAATQMVSSGFSPQEATGGALREQLRGMLATNIVGKEDTSTEEIIRATASYLSAQGLDKNEQNTRDVNSRIATLYKTTNMQFADFMEFARESVGMKGVVDIGTQLASLSSLVDVMTAAEGATGLRNVVQRMRTVRGTPEKTEGLKMLGIKPEEVDLIGEDLLSAFRRINEGIKQTKPQDIPVALKKIFEERGVAVAQHLLNSVDVIAQRIDEQKKGVDQYARDVAFAQEGLNAALRRQESEQKGFMAKTGKDRDQLMYAESRQYMLEKGMAPWRADLNIEMAKVFGYLNGATADVNLAPTPVTGLPISDKQFQVIQQRVNAKIQGLDISPDAIERNMMKQPEVKQAVVPPLIPRLPPGAFEKPFLDQFTRDEIEQYRREIASGKKQDTRPMRSRLYALRDNPQTGKRAESLVEGIQQKIDDGLSQEEIAGLRGEINHAGSVTKEMGKNSEAYLLFGQLDAMRKRLDDADSGALGTAAKIDASLRSGATPEEARGLLPRIEESRQGSQALPDVERQQLQFRLDALEQAIKAMTDAVEENTRATEGNTTMGEGSPAAEPQTSRLRYSPVSKRLGRV